MTGYDEKSTSFSASLQSMQAEIEKLHSALQTLSDKVDAKPNTPTPFATPNLWPNANRPGVFMNTPKRLRNNNGSSINVINDSNRTGTKSAVGIRTVRIERLPEDELTWIYLSAFHPSTAESQIKSLAMECLDMPSNMSPKVIKLVPKGTDPKTLNFVSFKIGIHEQFKDKALTCDSWPVNVRFRIFEDNRAKNGPKIVSLSSTQSHPEINPQSTMETSDSTSGET